MFLFSSSGGKRTKTSINHRLVNRVWFYKYLEMHWKQALFFDVVINISIPVSLHDRAIISLIYGLKKGQSSIRSNHWIHESKWFLLHELLLQWMLLFIKVYIQMIWRAFWHTSGLKFFRKQTTHIQLLTLEIKYNEPECW